MCGLISCGLSFMYLLCFFPPSLFLLFNFLQEFSQRRRNTKNNQLDFQYFERKTPKLRSLTVSILSREKDDDFRERASKNEERFVVERRKNRIVKEAEDQGDDSEREEVG